MEISFRGELSFGASFEASLVPVYANPWWVNASDTCPTLVTWAGQTRSNTPLIFCIVPIRLAHWHTGTLAHPPMFFLWHPVCVLVVHPRCPISSINTLVQAQRSSQHSACGRCQCCLHDGMHGWQFVSA